MHQHLKFHLQLKLCYQPLYTLKAIWQTTAVTLIVFIGFIDDEGGSTFGNYSVVQICLVFNVKRIIFTELNKSVAFNRIFMEIVYCSSCN